MELKLVGLVGDSRSGKDSVAKILQDDFGFQQKAMAGGIREILLGLNPVIKDNGGVVWELLDLFDECHGDWDKIKARSSESTEYMIRLGQTCRDVLGETVWLNRVLPAGEVKENICISDTRQPNEYWAIKNRGGSIWKVVRPGVAKRGMDGLLDTYEFDAVLHNRGTLEELRGIVQATVASVLEIRKIRGMNHGR